MSDKIELMRLCGVLQSNFSCLSQSESRTKPCHVTIDLLPLFVRRSHTILGKEKLLIGSAVSRTHSLPITYRNKHKS